MEINSVVDHRNGIHGVHWDNLWTRWCPPHAGMIKINCDTSLGKNGWTGLGVICTDNGGLVIFTTMRRIPTPSSIELAKALAILWQDKKRYTLNTSGRGCPKSLQFTSRPYNPIFLIGSCSWWYLLCRMMFSSITYSWIRRDYNMIAHVLAQMALCNPDRYFVNLKPLIFLFPCIL